MKFGRMLALSFAAALTVAPPAYAQDDMGDLTTKKPARRQTVEEENNDPTRNGPFLGLGATYAIENFDAVGYNADNSGGFNAHVGYRFNRWVAADLQVERYANFDGPDPTAANDDSEVNGWAVGLNGKGYFLPGRFQPWAQIGMTYLDMETTDTITAPANPNKTDDGPALRFGAGLDVYATNKFVVVADVSYLLGFGEVDGYDIVAVSLGFLFRP